MTVKFSRADAIQKFNSVHKGKYDYSKVEWVDRNTPVCIVCPLHGQFYQTYATHAMNRGGCRQCALANKKTVRFSEEELILLKALYPTNATRAEVMAAFPERSWRSIVSKAMRLGLTSDRKHSRPDKLSHLLEGTVKNAYLWGLIYADGYLSEQVGLNISLWKEDEEYLLRLGEQFHLGTTQAADSIGSMRRLKVQDAARIRELKQLLDYHEKKTYNPPTHFDFLSTPEMRLAFFVGLVDGDGNIQYAANGKFRCIRVLMHHNWFPFLKMLSDQLTSDTSIEFTVNATNSRSNAYLYMGKIANHDFLVQFIKEQDLPVLRRKWRV